VSQPFGAVRVVRTHELVVDIEGHGEVAIPARSIVAVHDGKVLADVEQTNAAVQRAIAAAHRQEKE
jgi:hypothetical protein